MRVLYACCVVLFSTAFGSGSVWAQQLKTKGNVSSSCDQCSTLVEQHELLVQKITKLRGRRKSLEARETLLIKKRQSKQDALLKLQARHASLQQDELQLAKRAGKSAKTVRAKLVAKRKTIEREEFEIRADLLTLSKAVPQAQAAARRADRDLDRTINERLTIMQAMANCEQRCIVASGPGTVVLTAASIADVAQSNQAQIRRAAQNTAACRDCNRLRDQIETTTVRIAERQKSEKSLRERMTDLDRRRQAIRNEWRDLYDRYSDRLLARLNDTNIDPDSPDRKLNRISEQIVSVNGRWQRLLTREGNLQDQLMQSSADRDRLGKERRRLRAALGACEELCVAGKPDPANTGLRLASGRINVAKAEAKCARCGSLARLVNEVTGELDTLQSQRTTLESRFNRIAPALEQIQARRKSIIRYAGELADLMEDFRQSGDVARAKRELAQISARSQRLSTDIIRLLDQREKLEGQIDTNADTITRLSILSRQRRRELQECEVRCNAPKPEEQQLALVKPDLTFSVPTSTDIRCERCQTHGIAIDQLVLLQQSEQASLTVANGQFQLRQGRLTQINRALELNARSIRDARNRNGTRSSSAQRNLIRGLEGEARTIRAERTKLTTSVESAKATRDAINTRIENLAQQIRTRRQELQSCESSCRIVSEAPAATLSRAQSMIRRVNAGTKSCDDCSAKETAMKEFAADIRSDIDKLQNAIGSTRQSAGRITGFTRRIERNRTTVLSGVRRWFALEDPKRREARTRSVISEAFDTARLAKTASDNMTSHAKSAADQAQAQSSLTGTLPSLDAAIKSYERCSETCDENKTEEPEFDISEFQEKNPESLVVKPVTRSRTIARCADCRNAVEALNQMRSQRAVAAARVATARNITRSASSINRRIAVRSRETRNRVAELIQARFQEENATRKAALKTRLDGLETQTRQLDRAKRRQDNRLRQAASDIDAARQDIRRLDREISAASETVRTCETQCKVASNDTFDDDRDENGEENNDTGNDNTKDVARLPGAETNPDTENRQTQDDNTPTDEEGSTGSSNVADAGEIPSPTPTSDTGTDTPAPAACKRCAVFSKRIAALSNERGSRRSERDNAVKDRQRLIQAIRAHTGTKTQRATLTRERRKLTRLIEARNATVDRIESRLRRLRASLTRCENVCNAPSEIASSDEHDLDEDTIDVAEAPKSTRKPRARRKNDDVFANEDLPRRKKAPKQKTAMETVLGGVPQVFGTLDRLGNGEWETTVDVAIGTGNVWAPETATLSVVPGNGDVKLDATTFAATITARDLSVDGGGTIAWGSLKVTRADSDDTETAGAVVATRTTDYDKIRGTVGLGRETYDCLSGSGTCALGLMAGVEHTSYDDTLTAATSSQSTSVSNTAGLLGVWGQTRLPLGGFDATGIALVLKGNAYVKGGRASGTIATAAIATTTQAKASSGYIGVGADLAAELEFSLDQVQIAIGGEVGVDTLPTITQSGAGADIDTDRSTSSTVYIRGKIKF